LLMIHGELEFVQKSDNSLDIYNFLNKFVR